MPVDSSAVRFLKGKLYPGAQSPVVNITKLGDIRLVHLKDNTIDAMTKKELVTRLHKVLSQEQKMAMEASKVRHRDGTVTMQIGGMVKGKAKTYVSEAAANRALKRHYGK